ncbi:M23 family metallopeptidase [bacterium]|nr:MAG: M23 family metallopeptidase [bacterium]
MSPFVPLLLAGYPAEWGPPPPVAPFGMAPLPHERIILPIIFPVIGATRWRDSYGDRRSGFLHTGIDIAARKMSPIVAPFGGTIGLKRNSFWIYADNGWAMLGTHLNDDTPGRNDGRGSRDLMFAPDVSAGSRVRAGQLIGYVGDSGMATGPHLHFELYKPGTGATMERIRNPRPSLHMAQRISRPVVTFLPGKPPKGKLRLQGCIRKLDEAASTLTMILASKQLPNGLTRAVSRPMYVKLRLDRTAVEAAGGYEAIKSISEATPFGVLISAQGGYQNARVSEIVLPDPVTTGGDVASAPLRQLRARSSKPAPARR